MAASVDRFIEIEAAYDCFSFEVAGVRYWHLIRTWLFMRLFHQSNGMGDSHPDISKNRSIGNIVRHVPQLISQVMTSRRQLRENHDAEICVIGTGRLSLRDGVLSAPLVAPVMESFDRALILDRPERLLHERHEYSERSIITDAIEMEWMVAYATGACSHYARRALRQIEGVLAELRSEFNADISDRTVLDRLRYALSCSRVVSRRLDDLIERNAFSCCVEIVHYNTFCLVATERFRRHSIPVIELQHGLIGPAHPAYNLSGRGSEHYLPDAIATFGDLWSKGIRMPAKETRLVPCGSPTYDSFNYQNERSQRRGDVSVLIVSQPELDSPLDDCAIALAARHPGWNVMYRLHPSETRSWKSLHPKLSAPQSSVIVLDDPLIPLQDQLSTATCVVGMSSTVLFEAAAYRLPVFIVESRTESSVRMLLDYGFAKSVADYSEVEEYLDAAWSPCADVDGLWKRDATANIARLIKSVVDG